MRRLNYEEYRQSLQGKALRLYTRAAAQGERGKREKPRALEEERLLFFLDRRRWQRALASGRLEKIGPRRYRWHG